MLRGKHIILGITGSIAAYKSAALVRELIRAGAEVRVVMTPAACEFITPLTLGTLSGHDVILDMFPQTTHSTWHIHLGLWADAMLVAPASANTIAKLAHGFADTALSALALALRCPLVVAPVMDSDMLLHPATQANIEILRSRGTSIIEPESGELASGLRGAGRLPEIFDIIAQLDALLAAAGDLAGIPVLITAGPTYEDIDPVRFLGNRSSGKMGFALAEVAAQRGADVTLVSGPVHLDTPRGVMRIDVRSAGEMFDCVNEHAHNSKVLIMSAAVADFSPETKSAGKIKKESIAGDALSIPLRKTTDILAQLGRTKKNQVLVGFALETEQGEENAMRKLRQKNADIIVLNNPNVRGAGFETPTNVATILSSDGTVRALQLMPKAELAGIILDLVASMLRNAAQAVTPPSV